MSNEMAQAAHARMLDAEDELDEIRSLCLGLVNEGSGPVGRILARAVRLDDSLLFRDADELRGLWGRFRAVLGEEKDG